MEETSPQTHSMSQPPEVSFPQPRDMGARGSNAKVIIAVVGVILIVIIGGWFILGNNSGGTTASPTPQGLSTFPSPTTETPSPSPTATPTAPPKKEVRIEVLNGTGVAGEAGFLQDALKELGFVEIESGNAEEQDQEETVVTYSRELSPAIADEITAKLEELYTSVRIRRATISGDFDVSIITGPRKAGSATSSPVATSSPTPSPEAEEE